MADQDRVAFSELHRRIEEHEARMRDALVHVRRARAAARAEDDPNPYLTIGPARASVVREHLRFAEELLS